MSAVKSYILQQPADRLSTANVSRESVAEPAVCVADMAQQLAQLSAEQREVLLAPYLVSVQQQLQTALEAKWSAEQEQCIKRESAKAVAVLKEEYKQVERQHINKLEKLIENFDYAEVTTTAADAEHMLTMALSLAEKVLNQQLQQTACYQKWAENIVAASRGHRHCTLHINKQDYAVLSETGLLQNLQDKVDRIAEAQIGRFSFELRSDSGISGYNSQAVLERILALLKPQEHVDA